MVERPRSAPIHGAIVIDKPEGPTSFTAMRQAGRALGSARAGHTGTLDPAASGVLVVLLGEATKLAGVLVHDDKVYEARIRFGIATDTLDREGAIVSTAPVDAMMLAPDTIRAALAPMVGEVMQVPPVYSALKRDGRTLMSRARKGEIVEVDARPVVCHALELISVEMEPEPVATVRVHCGKGYYVRSLARDLGVALGLPAHLAGLRRLRVGPFGIESAVAPHLATADNIIGIAALLAHWRHVGCDTTRTTDIRCGRAVPHTALPVVANPSDAPVDRALALDPAGVPLALLRSEGAHWKVERGFMIDIPERHD